MSASTVAAIRSPARQSWLEHGAALALLILLTLVGFHDAIGAAVQVWWVSPTYSHCFLIIPISAWLAWEKRRQLSQLEPAVEPRALWLLLPILFVWWVGELSTINEARQLAVIGLVQILIVAMLGLDVYRAIWFPALYLFFLVPTGEYLIGPMQQFATRFTEVSLNLLGVPHFTQGTLIELTNGKFEIAEACAGLRFLIATVALGVLFAYMMFRRWYKIVIFLVSCVVVPLVGNGLRIVGIILLAHYSDNKYGAGADHIVYGWGFNVAILIFLFLLGSLFRDSFDEADFKIGVNKKHDSRKETAIVFLSAALLLSIGPATAYWHDGRAIAPDIAGLRAPLRLNSWQVSPPSGMWRPDFPGIDSDWAVSMSSESEAMPVDLYVGYYARARTGHSLTAHLNKLWNDATWSPLSSDHAVARIGSSEIMVEEWIVTSAFEKRMVWATYWMDGTFTTSLLKLKLLQAQAAFGGHEGEAVVAVSTIVDSTDDAARARLLHVLSDLKELPERLNRANHRAPDTANAN